MEFPDNFFQRQDESDDSRFYGLPRLVTHIDDATIDSLTAYYRETVPADARVLDLMSSWISHLPEDVNYPFVAGLGMNQAELASNKQLNDHVVHNLNQEPTLPYSDTAFDVILIAVSVQYLTRPLEVFDDVARVLAPGGKCIVGMSHRLFPTKAIYAFHVLPPADRCQLVAAYMNHSGLMRDIAIEDRSPHDADPLWIVTGTKKVRNL